VVGIKLQTCFIVALFETSEAFGLFTIIYFFKRRKQERTRFLLNCGALNVSCCCPDQNKRSLRHIYSIFSLRNSCVTSVSKILVVAMVEIKSWDCGRHKITNVSCCCIVGNKLSLWPLSFLFSLDKKEMSDTLLLF
jgi:hypothetical protein